MDADWLESDEAAALLDRTERQLLRYATSGRVKTRQRGRRRQYRRTDVEALATEIADTRRTRPANVAPEVGRALVETLQVQRELIEAQRQLLAAQSEIAGLRAEVERLQGQRRRYIDIIGELQKRAEGKR
jgi:hypothetical protein